MRAVLIGFLLVILAGVGLYAYEGLNIAGPDMPQQGYAALSMGIVLSLVVGIGLMTLLFYSSRHGHDEPPHFK